MKNITIVILLLLIMGCAQPEQPDDDIQPEEKKDVNMNVIEKKTDENVNPFLSVKQGDLVRVHYTGRLEDGEIFDSSQGKKPLEFIAGRGMMIKGFDNGVLGMKKGEKKTIKVSPEEGYGEYDESKKEFIGRKVFEDQNISTEIGTSVWAKGMWGEVIGYDGNNTLRILVDFNHKLAGKTIVFDVEVVDIKRKI